MWKSLKQTKKTHFEVPMSYVHKGKLYVYSDQFLPPQGNTYFNSEIWPCCWIYLLASKRDLINWGGRNVSEVEKN